MFAKALNNLAVERGTMERCTDPNNMAHDFCASLHRRLNTWPVAAAALVSLLALAQPSEAKVVYTPANVVIQDAYYLDVNNDGVIDFTIQNTVKFTNRCDEYAYVDELPASGNGVVPSYDINGEWPAALTRGATIGSGPQFEGSFATMAFFSVNCPFVHSEGPWVDVVQHYLGLRFQANGQIHYGWAALTVVLHEGRGGGGSFVVTLTGYAYETISGKSILAGQTSATQYDPAMKPEDSGPAASVNNPVLETPQTVSLERRTIDIQGVPSWPGKESSLEGN